MDPKKVFALKWVIIMGFIASGLAFGTWIIIAVFMGIDIIMLVNAATFFVNMTQVSITIIDAAGWMMAFVGGLIFSGLMLLITIFLMQDDSVILFKHAFSYTELGVLMITFSTLNIFLGSTGFYVGDILGIVSGAFAIVHEYYYYTRPIAERKRKEKLESYKQKNPVKAKPSGTQKPIIIKVDEKSNLD